MYDKKVDVCVLPSGSPLTGKLKKSFTRLAEERTVYASRYWEAVQAGSSIDKLLVMPRFPGEIVRGEMYVKLDRHVWRIEQAQEDVDADGRPVWMLSIRRMEGSYDVAGHS